MTRLSRWPAPGAVDAPGAGLAVLVNANAKRGGRRVAAQIARVLPGASVRLTKSPQEIDAWLRGLAGARAVLAAGGDGSAVALVNALARVAPDEAPWPTLGILPLGTGNGWAHALGAPKLHRCLELLARSAGPLPARPFGLVQVDGMLSHFAGSGFDAMVLEDYQRQLDLSRGPGRRISKSVYGYVLAALMRTTPRVLLRGIPRVVIENTGDTVYAVDPDGRPRRLSDARPGTVLYEGPAATAAAATCPEYGYRFKAFPFAERIPGLFNLRIYSLGPVRAVLSMRALWRGTHPLAGMHDWLASAVRMRFSRPVPLQVGGDAHGVRDCVEYRAAPRRIRMLDWRRIG